MRRVSSNLGSSLKIPSRKSFPGNVYSSLILVGKRALHKLFSTTWIPRRRRCKVEVSYEQPQCLLFRLPFELREYIYVLAIGQYYVDLFHPKSDNICLVHNSDDEYRRFVKPQRQPWSRWLSRSDAARLAVHHPKIPPYRRDKFGRIGTKPLLNEWYYYKQKSTDYKHVLGLLVTCRRIYDESNVVPYRNTFQITDRRIVTALPQSLDARHLQSLRTLRLHYHVRDWLHPAYPMTSLREQDAGAYREWDEYWDSLSMMTGLDDLFVRVWDLMTLDRSVAEQGTFNGQRLLAPLQRINRPRLFRLMLALPGHVESTSLRLQGTNLKVIRTRNLSQESSAGLIWARRSREGREVVENDQGSVELWSKLEALTWFPGIRSKANKQTIDEILEFLTKRKGEPLKEECCLWREGIYSERRSRT